MSTDAIDNNHKAERWGSFLRQLRNAAPHFRWTFDRWGRLRGHHESKPDLAFCPIHAVYFIEEGRYTLPTAQAGEDNPGIHSAAWAMGYESISLEIVDAADGDTKSKRGRQLCGAVSKKVAA